MWYLLPVGLIVALVGAGVATPGDPGAGVHGAGNRPPNTPFSRSVVAAPSISASKSSCAHRVDARAISALKYRCSCSCASTARRARSRARAAAVMSLG